MSWNQMSGTITSALDEMKNRNFGGTYNAKGTGKETAAKHTLEQEREQAISNFAYASGRLDEFLVLLKNESNIWYKTDVDAFGSADYSDRSMDGGKARQGTCTPKQLLDAFDKYLDSYWGFIIELTAAIDRPIVAEKRSELARVFKANTDSFKPVVDKVIEIVGAEESTEKLKSWNIKTNKLLEDGWNKAK